MVDMVGIPEGQRQDNGGPGEGDTWGGGGGVQKVPSSHSSGVCQGITPRRLSQPTRPGGLSVMLRERSLNRTPRYILLTARN